MNQTLPRMNQAQLQKMILLQAKETAREQALGIASQIVVNAIKAGIAASREEVVSGLFAYADLLKPRLESELIAAKMAEVQTSVEGSEVVS